MNIGQMIAGIVSSLPNMMTGLLIDISVQSKSTEIDPATNKLVVSPSTNKNYKAEIDYLTDDEKESSVLKVTDLKLIVFANGDVIDTKALVVINRPNAETFNIIKCEPIYVGSISTINILYLKK